MAPQDEDEGKGFAALFAEAERAGRGKAFGSRPAVGEEVSGTVSAIGADGVFVDLGAKTEGVIDRGELDDGQGGLCVAVGDTIRARVVESREGSIRLRVRAARGHDEGATELVQAYQHALPVLGRVAGVNKGGVDVEVAGVRAFCPASQLDLGYVAEPASLVGQTLEFRVTRCDSRRAGAPDVVLSRRALLEAERAKRLAELRASLTVGAVVRGTVRRIKEFGAFVDLGGIDGLIPTGELRHGRVSHPRDVLSVGDAVEVQVTKVEPASGPGAPDRIALSLKALSPDPWQQAGTQLARGTRVKGRVVRLEAFGAFVLLDGGLEGLLHASELVEGRRVNHAREILSAGQEIDAVVIDVDPARRRISLSLKAVAAQQEAEQAASYRPSGPGSLGTFGELLRGKLRK
ncbi:MAG: S1 RNA-binding domain-containing protein [Deltaproteobacteria bacterium]|nr:S1 RNA-binding domain-containing protein [Deltaproteobacteria bacterium]